MKLYLATTNLHKIEELSEMLREAKIDAEVHTPLAVGGMPVSYTHLTLPTIYSV